MKRKEEFLRKKFAPPKNSPNDVTKNDFNADMELETDANVTKDHQHNISNLKMAKLTIRGSQVSHH